MAKRIWNKTRRLFKDGDAGPVTDGSVTVRVGGTSTPAAVYTDKSLSTVVSGSVVNFNSDGYLEISGNEVNLYVADDVTADLLIQATGFNGSAALTEEDAAIAESATVAEDYRTGFKNALSNGDFASWSGATSGSNASGDDDGDETADGWYLAQPSAASNEWSRQAAAGTGARYGYRFGRPSSSTSANEIRLWKILAVGEAYRLRGQTITVSFSAKAGANFSGSALSFKFATGTTENEDGDGIKAASWGGFSLASSQNVAITTTLTRYSYSFTVGSGIKEAGVQFAFTGSGTAGANDWVQVEDVQVEIAASASAFEAPPEYITFLLNAPDVRRFDDIHSKGADIASASSIDLAAATGNFLEITGTTTITALGTAAVGVVRKVRTASAVQFTHSAAILLPGNQNLTTASGDVLEFTSLGSGNWRCTAYLSETPKLISLVLTSGLTAAHVELNNNGLRVKDTGGDHLLSIIPGRNLTAARSLTIDSGDANRTLDIAAGDVTISTSGAALIDDASAAAQRTTLGLGTAAVANTGTSGANLPACDSDKTFVGTLTLRKNAGGVLTVDRTGDDGTIVAIQQDGSTEGSISVSGTTVAYNTFLGSHWSQLADWTTPDIPRGTIIETIDTLCRWVWDEWTEVIPAIIERVEMTAEIRRMRREPYAGELNDGDSYDDLNGARHAISMARDALVDSWEEVVPATYQNVETAPEQRKTHRIFYRGDLAPGASYEDDGGITHRIIEEATDRLPRAKVSDAIASKRVYGVFLHWERDDGAPDMYVAALGAGFIRVAANQAVSGGELIESNGDGCGRVQADDLMRSSTVAKITSAEIIETYSDGSRLYPCTLHCG